MKSVYRRKRIPGLPPEPTRAIDDELASLELATSVALTAVADDPAPVLGGPLRTKGQPIIVSNVDDVEQGRLEDAAGSGVSLGNSSANVLFQGTRATLHSTSVVLDALATGSLKTVMVDGSGLLYTGAGGGGSGVTNLGVANITADTITVTSDTGQDAILPSATGVAAGVATAAQVTLLGTAVQPSRAIATGAGMLGGGNLSADRTLSADFGTVSGKVCEGNDSRLYNPYRIKVAGAQVGALDFSTLNYTALFATDAAGLYQTGWGAMEVSPAGIRLAGTAVKIDSLATGSVKAVQADASGNLTTANVLTGTNLSITGQTATGLTIFSSTGNPAAVPAATAVLAGLMTAAQFTALGIAVPNTRQVLTANGLTGGGALTADLTLVPTYGSALNTVCQGNDGRLSDARTPLAHNQLEATITDLDRLRFKGYWLFGTAYKKNDVVIDGPYLCRALADNTTRPGPVIVNADTWAMAGTTWTLNATSTYVGARYKTLPSTALVSGVRFRADIAGRTVTDGYFGLNGIKAFTFARNVTVGATFIEIHFPAFRVLTADVLDVAMLITGGFAYVANYYSGNGGVIQGFRTTNELYPPSSFDNNGYGIDIYYSLNNQAPEWQVLCKTA